MAYWNDPAAMQEGIVSTNPFGNYTVVDAAPRELLPLIDPHWYQFPPMNPLWYGMLGFWMCIVGLFAFSGNAIAVYIFMTTKALRSPANTLVAALAVNDFIMISAMCPAMVVNCYYRTWAFSYFGCQLYGFIGALCGAMSINLMVCITMDRYNVIVKGMSGKPLTNGRVAIMLIVSFIVAMFWTATPFFGWNQYVPEGNLTACGTDYLTETMLSRSYLYALGFFSWLCPLIYIIFAYFHIVKAVWAHESQMKAQAKKMGVKSLRNEETQKTSNEMKLAKVALMNVSLWFMAWTPYLIINLSGVSGRKDLITPLFTIWGSVFAKMNAIYNPIIYAISHPKYKAALEQKIPCLSCASEPQYVSSGSDNESTGTAAEEKA